MKNKLLILAALLSGFTSSYLFSQEQKLYQLSGVVADLNSKKSLPYVNILVKNSRRGTVSDLKGFFSIVVRSGDTLLFSEVGYKRQFYLVPDTLKGYKQSIAVYLTQDTILLDEAIIYPWPSKDDFKEAFADLQISSPAEEIVPYSGFRRIDNPIEPAPSIFNPVNLFYEKVVKKIQYNSRKRKQAEKQPKWD